MAGGINQLGFRTVSSHAPSSPHCSGKRNQRRTRLKAPRAFFAVDFVDFDLIDRIVGASPKHSQARTGTAVLTQTYDRQLVPASRTNAGQGLAQATSGKQPLMIAWHSSDASEGVNGPASGSVQARVPTGPPRDPNPQKAGFGGPSVATTKM